MQFHQYVPLLSLAKIQAHPIHRCRVALFAAVIDVIIANIHMNMCQKLFKDDHNHSTVPIPSSNVHYPYFKYIDPCDARFLLFAIYP